MNRSIKKSFSYWPYAIIGSFILLAIFDAGIVRLALKTQVSPMEDSPYEAGLQYEGIVQAKDAALRDGISAKFVPSGAVSVIEIHGPDSSKARILDLKLLRPDDATLDRHLRLTEQVPGRFEITGGPLKPGLWLIQGMLSDGEKQYYFESQSQVPSIN